MYQCAEMATIARGRGMLLPNRVQASVYRFVLERVHRAAVPDEHRRHRGCRTHVVHSNDMASSVLP